MATIDSLSPYLHAAFSHDKVGSNFLPLNLSTLYLVSWPIDVTEAIFSNTWDQVIKSLATLIFNTHSWDASSQHPAAMLREAKARYRHFSWAPSQQPASTQVYESPFSPLKSSDASTIWLQSHLRSQVRTANWA